MLLQCSSMLLLAECWCWVEMMISYLVFLTPNRRPWLSCSKCSHLFPLCYFMLSYERNAGLLPTRRWGYADNSWLLSLFTMSMRLMPGFSSLVARISHWKCWRWRVCCVRGWVRWPCTRCWFRRGFPCRGGRRLRRHHIESCIRYGRWSIGDSSWRTRCRISIVRLASLEQLVFRLCICSYSGSAGWT